MSFPSNLMLASASDAQPVCATAPLKQYELKITMRLSMKNVALTAANVSKYVQKKLRRLNVTS